MMNTGPSRYFCDTVAPASSSANVSPLSRKSLPMPSRKISSPAGMRLWCGRGTGGCLTTGSWPLVGAQSLRSTAAQKPSSSSTVARGRSSFGVWAAFAITAIRAPSRRAMTVCVVGVHASSPSPQATKIGTRVRARLLVRSGSRAIARQMPIKPARFVRSSRCRSHGRRSAGAPARCAAQHIAAATVLRPPTRISQVARRRRRACDKLAPSGPESSKVRLCTDHGAVMATRRATRPPKLCPSRCTG